MIIIQYFLEYYDRCPDIIKLSWILICVFLFSIVINIIYLAHLRGQLRRKEAIEKQYQEVYEEDLITYLFSENEDRISPEQRKIVDKFRSAIKSPFKREILINTLLKLKNEIAGDTAETIDNFYIQIGLSKYALAYLKSRTWYLNAKGVRELTQFNVKKAQKLVISNINHPRKEVRKEVQLYLVSVFHFEGLSFLDTLETPLSGWDQIRLLDILTNINTHDTFDIKDWLSSTNDSVVQFTLHLAKIFNLFDIKDELTRLLDHPNERIRVDTIYLLNHFFIVETKEILKNSFEQRGTEEQIAIFKMLENTFDSNDEPFASKHIDHDNFDIKISARKILRDINLERYNLLSHEINRTINPEVTCTI